MNLKPVTFDDDTFPNFLNHRKRNIIKKQRSRKFGKKLEELRTSCLNLER